MNALGQLFPSDDFTLLGVILGLPLLGAIVNGIWGRRLGKDAVRLMALGVLGLAFIASLVTFVQLAHAVDATGHQETIDGVVRTAHEHVKLSWTAWDWIHTTGGEGSADVQIPLKFSVDALSGVMMLVVTGVGFLIHLYSTCVHGRGRCRIRALLRVFESLRLRDAGADPWRQPSGHVRRLGRRRSVLVPAHRLLVRQAAQRSRRQEGLHREPNRRFRADLRRCFYLYTTRAHSTGSASQSPRRTRSFDTPADMRSKCTSGRPAAVSIPTSTSARSPFRFHLLNPCEAVHDHRLPPRSVDRAAARLHRQERADSALHLVARDAMAGPDAGFRAHPRRHHGHGRHLSDLPSCPSCSCSRRSSWRSVAFIGAATAALGGHASLSSKTDIKKVLAYSHREPARLHVHRRRRRRVHGRLFPRHHARVLQGLPLFLGAGSVIHAMHGRIHDDVASQDMRNMGGLEASTCRYTRWTFLISTRGHHPVVAADLSGFFSKDEILYRAYVNHVGQSVCDASANSSPRRRCVQAAGVVRSRDPLFHGLGIAATMTAFYMCSLLHPSRSRVISAVGPSAARPCSRSQDPDFAHLGHGHDSHDSHDSHDAHASEDEEEDDAHAHHEDLSVPGPAPHESPLFR